MFTLSAAGGWFGKETPFEKRIEMAAQRGFKAVEILQWVNAYLDLAAKTIRRTGCQVSALLCKPKNDELWPFLANTHGLVHEDALPALKIAMRDTLEAAQKLGCPNIIVTSGNERFDVPRFVQHQNLVRALIAAAEIVDGTGVTVVLEPLNVLVNHAGYYLTSTQEGVEVIGEVGVACVRLLYDVYHQQITEGNVIANLTKHIASIGHIHVADVPGRKEPGTGELNYRNILRAIEQTGYDRYVAFECGLTEDVDVVCQKMLHLMD